MIKIRHKTQVMTVKEFLEFLDQYPDDRKIDEKLFDDLKIELKKLNSKKRVAKMRQRQKEKK